MHRSNIVWYALMLSTATCFPRAIFQRANSARLLVRWASVSGPVYQDDTDDQAPVVTLFTKEGCTLCDKVKDVLVEVRPTHPHSLEQVDITDDADSKEQTSWWARYKYDIPVLHVDGQYWVKHRLTPEQAREGLDAVAQGTFISRTEDEPNAAAYERK